MKKDDRDVYPEASDMKDKKTNLDYIPPCLRLLLSSIIKSKNSDLLVASIGQAIMQAVALRSFLMPLQLAVAISPEHKYGCRALVDLLNSLGFCSSYAEADRYRKNAALLQGVSADAENLLEDTLIQWSADNVDHDSLTRDGRNQIHMMGMMVSLTPATTAPRKIQRKDKIEKNDIIEAGQVRIIGQSDPRNILKDIIYTKLLVVLQDESFCSIDYLWQSYFEAYPTSVDWFHDINSQG